MAASKTALYLSVVVAILYVLTITWVNVKDVHISQKKPIPYIRETTNQHKFLEVDNSPPFIILMAQWRFGSSVLGELFNQNPDLFYIFESLWPTTKLRKMRRITQYTPESQALSREILHGFAKCKFSSDWLKVLRAWGGYRNRHERGICLNSTSCRLESTSVLGNFCRTFEGRLATKVIHADLEMLRPLVVENNINLKIIHLVRDPRGVTASRIEYLTKMYRKEVRKVEHLFLKLGRVASLGLLNDTAPYMLPIQEMNDNNPTARGMCEWIRENTYVSQTNLPAWLKGRYHLVRYEDFIKAPLVETRRIYNFTGLPLTAELERFVWDTTHPNSSDARILSTRKDALHTANQWTKHLTVMEARQIERECKDVLNILNYEL